MNNDNKLINKLVSRAKLYLFLIALLLIKICITDNNLIVPAVIFYIAIVLYTLWVNSKKKSEIESHIEEVAIGMNFAVRNYLNKSPIPLIVIETDGNVIFKSPRFIKEFSSLNDDIDINTYLESIIKEIKLEIENKDKKEIIKQITIENKVYKIFCEYSASRKRDKRRRKEYVLSLYFIDDTKYNELFDKYTNEKVCIGVAMIDNYEEIIQRLLPEEKLQVIATVEKAIYDWASSTGGVIVKSDRDLFIYIFEQKYLSEIEKNKVQILDLVKEIDSRTPITLSIAISNEGENYYERYKSAMAGLDIVLGRGGDQAIIRKDGKYKFYGGTTLEVEKRTKVKARIVAHTLEELIKDSDNVVIMGHKNGDIDSLGSSLGLYRIAKTLGKEAYVVSDIFGASLGKFVDTLKSADEYKNVIIDEKEALLKVKDNTLLIVVDTHKKSLVQVPELLNKTTKIVVIDHHRKSTDFIENVSLSLHEVYASSAAELVTEIIQYTDVDVKLTDGQDNVVLVTEQGLCITFDEKEVRPMGRVSQGVIGIRLDKDDEVIGMESVIRGGKATLLAITENGFGKRTELEEYRVQKRGGRGVITYKITPKTGKLIGVRIAVEDDDVMLVTDTGTIIRLNVNDISILGRSTQGVTLMRTNDGGKVVSLETLNHEMHLNENEK